MCCPWPLTLTLIQPASKWMHSATLRRHPDLLWVAIPASSVIPILSKSLLTVRSLYADVITWTSLKPWNLPVQRMSRYALVINSYHLQKPEESSFTEYVIHTVLSSSDSDGLSASKKHADHRAILWFPVPQLRLEQVFGVFKLLSAAVSRICILFCVQRLCVYLLVYRN